MKTKCIIIVCLLLSGIYQLKAEKLVTETEESMPVIEEYSRPGRWRFAVGGGYAYRLGERQKESDAVADKASKKLMHGGHLDVEGQFFFNEVWGIGLTTNFVSAGTGMKDIYLISGGESLLLDKYNVRNNFFFVGPSGVVKGDFGKWELIGSMALGPIFFKETTTMHVGRQKYSADATKATFGVNVGIGAEYRFTEKLGGGLKMSYTVGTIDSIRIDGNNYELTESFSVSNLMITAFLSFRCK